MDHTVHGILQARMPELTTFPFSRWVFPSRDRTQVSHIAGGFFTIITRREEQLMPLVSLFFFSPLISQASLHRQMQKHFSVWYYIFPLIYGNLTSRIYFKLLASPLFFGYRWKLETECETHQRLSWLHTRITWEILNIGAQDALTEYSDLIPQGGHPNNGH